MKEYNHKGYTKCIHSFENQKRSFDMGNSGIEISRMNNNEKQEVNKGQGYDI